MLTLRLLDSAVCTTLEHHEFLGTPALDAAFFTRWCVLASIVMLTYDGYGLRPGRLLTVRLELNILGSSSAFVTICAHHTFGLIPALDAACLMPL